MRALGGRNWVYIRRSGDKPKIADADAYSYLIINTRYNADDN